MKDEANFLVVPLQQIVGEVRGRAAVGRAGLHHLKGVQIVVPLLPVDHYISVALAVPVLSGQHEHQHIGGGFHPLLHLLRLHVQQRVGLLRRQRGAAELLGELIVPDVFRLDVLRPLFSSVRRQSFVPEEFLNSPRAPRGIKLILYSPARPVDPRGYRTPGSACCRGDFPRFGTTR